MKGEIWDDPKPFSLVYSADEDGEDNTKNKERMKQTVERADLPSGST